MTVRSFLFALLLPAGLAHAGLTFQDPVQSFHRVPEDKSVEAKFSFTNTGSESVEIRRVKTSCGCTTAKLDRKVYAPGESGEITATFTFRGRRGPQRKIIWVTTADKAETVLDMRVWIHEPLTIRPALVYWRVGDKPSTKHVTLSAAEHQPTGIQSVKSSDPTITAELKTGKPGEEYVIDVTAADTTEKRAAE
ncbi:MAG: DUF1573 domain-containing protein, partial [Chthoniobacteraceae bacterium]